MNSDRQEAVATVCNPNSSELDWRFALVDIAIMDGQLSGHEVVEIVIQPTEIQ